jgi:hypothetical protein
MASHFINDPDHWRQRAGEMFALAAEIADADTKRTMLKIAKDYERLAARAQQRSSGG